MGPTIVVFVVLAGSFLIIRQFCLTSKEGQASRGEIVTLGIITWVFLLSVGAWIFMGFYFIFDLLVNRVLVEVNVLLLYGTVTGGAFLTNEALDTASVLFFVRRSALFHPLQPHTTIAQEELDKKKIRDVHRETSDKPFPTIGKNKRLLTDTEAAQFRQEMQAVIARPKRSIYFDAEFKALKSGSPVSVADPWKVYTFDHKLHELYDEMSEVSVDPQKRLLHFRLNIPGATAEAVKDPLFVFQLKQDLYQLFQVLNTDPWLSWYSEMFDHIAAVCFGIESDSFGRIQMYPFLKIEIPRTQLTQREGQFFNAADLHTIGTLTFENGKPLSGEL